MTTKDRWELTMSKIRDYIITETVESVREVAPVPLEIDGMRGLATGVTVRPFGGSITTEWRYANVNSAKAYITSDMTIREGVERVYAIFGAGVFNTIARYNITVNDLLETMGHKHGKVQKNETITPDGRIVRTANGDTRTVAEWAHDAYYDVNDNGSFICRRMTFAKAFHGFYDVAYAHKMEYARAHAQMATLEIRRSDYGVNIIGS